jgi:hypothetical protein
VSRVTASSTTWISGIVGDAKAVGGGGGHPGEPGHCASTTRISGTLGNPKAVQYQAGEPGHCNFYYLDLRYSGEHKNSGGSSW